MRMWSCRIGDRDRLVAMHVPDGMLSGSVCPVTAAMAGAGLLAAGWAAVRSPRRPGAAQFGAVAAMVFAGQMANFPISGGTSGHLLGGVLAAALLGAPWGVLAIALVVAVQALVFADGGLLVLGANVLNMAVIGAGLGGWLAERLRRAMPEQASCAVAAWASVVAASAAVAIELAADGRAALGPVFAAMVGTHALIGVGEAAITVVAVAALPSLARRRGGSLAGVALAAALLAVVLLAPIASTLPDGLEAVAGALRIAHQGAPTFVTPLADYSVRGMAEGPLATVLAGLAGVAASFGAGWVVAKGLTRGSAAAGSAPSA